MLIDRRIAIRHGLPKCGDVHLEFSSHGRLLLRQKRDLRFRFGMGILQFNDSVGLLRKIALVLMNRRIAISHGLLKRGDVHLEFSSHGGLLLRQKRDLLF